MGGPGSGRKKGSGGIVKQMSRRRQAKQQKSARSAAKEYAKNPKAYVKRINKG
jgi:hypothetical protein